MRASRPPLAGSPNLWLGAQRAFTSRKDRIVRYTVTARAKAKTQPPGAFDHSANLPAQPAAPSAPDAVDHGRDPPTPAGPPAIPNSVMPGELTNEHVASWEVAVGGRRRGTTAAAGRVATAAGWSQWLDQVRPGHCVSGGTVPVDRTWVGPASSPRHAGQ